MNTAPEEPAAEKIHSIQDIIASIEEAVHTATNQHVFRDGRDGSFTPAAGLLAQQLETLAVPQEEPVTAEDRQQAIKRVAGVIMGYSENEMFDHVGEEDARNMAGIIVNLFS